MGEPDELLPCSDKLAFDTDAAARATAATSAWWYGSKLKVYKCRHCHLYHLSSNSDE